MSPRPTPRGILLYLFLALTALPPTLRAGVTNLVFLHAKVIDATGSPAQLDSTVVITNGCIAQIGESKNISPPSDAQTINATGKFLIPGLWDMHVHWYGREYLPLFIANGVTGARIMWGFPEHHEWRPLIEQGSLIGPRLYIASSLVDGPKPLWPDSTIAGNAEEGRGRPEKHRASHGNSARLPQPPG